MAAAPALPSTLRMAFRRMAASEEAAFYALQPSWPALLACLDEHAKNMQQALAVHTSTACQPQKAPGVVQDLLVAGLRDAHVTGSGAWECTLSLPALYAAEDGHPFRVMVEAPSRKEVVKEPRMSCMHGCC